VPRELSTVRLVAWLVAAQAVGVAGLAGFYLVELFVATAEDRVRAVVAMLLALVAAAGLALVARGLFHRRRWARAPALVTNLLVLPVAFDLARGGRWYVGLPLLVWSLAVLVLLFVRSTDAELQE
jgi:hypothetical protein